jgi:phosphoglycerate kinase
MAEFLTLDDLEVKDKTVLVRVDINSPLDPVSKEILDDTRIRECAPTIKELVKKGAKVVVLAHQGRPKSEDFVPLEQHAKKLEQSLGIGVRYVNDVIGEKAQQFINSLKSGEVMLLDNVRFIPEENTQMSPEDAAKTEFVKKLAPLANFYVNDAFAAAHRSQPSLVGFPMVLPAAAGRLMERELKNLGQALSPEHPCVYVLGGAKIDDSLTIIENVLSKGTADLVLTGGLVAYAFLAASGHDLGKVTLELLKKKGFESQLDRAKNLLQTYGEKIKIPSDLAADADGNRVELSVDELPSEHELSDIGKKTVDEYSKLLSGAKTIIANGPLGVFEKEQFRFGTTGVLKAMAETNAFTIIGGGHVVAAAQEAHLASKIKHVSTGGGACISFLSGDKLPAMEVLVKSSQNL